MSECDSNFAIKANFGCFVADMATGEPRRAVEIFLVVKISKLKGLDSVPSVGCVFKSHACAPSCIAPRNHSTKKLETHIAGRKRFKIVPGTISCFIVYNF